MTAFTIAAAALAVVALALLLRPWWRDNRRAAGADSLPALNATIHRDRLAELDRDRADGVLSEADFAEARDELSRQLLDDTASADQPAGGDAGRRSAISIAVLLPVLAVALYAMLGTPAAVLPGAAQAQRATGEMEDLVAKLADRLEKNPANPEGWAMLARSYKSLGRWDDALRAFERIGPDLEKSAELLAEVAETQVQKSEGFDERSRTLIAKALRLEPDNMLALFLGGGEAFAAGRYAEAATLWEKLLPRLEPGAEDARMVEANIAQARERAGLAKAKVGAGKTAPGARGEAAKGTAAPAGASVAGRVELAAALKDKARPDDVVFVFARAVDGPRMPLAALRLRVADLPADFTLDDRHALSPAATISSAAQLRIEVRVSRSGRAEPGPGDLTGASPTVKPGAKGVRVVIDRAAP